MNAIHQHQDITNSNRYGQMILAIRECYAVDEVKMMRDQARALEE
jgi:hypothetical protein